MKLLISFNYFCRFWSIWSPWIRSREPQILCGSGSGSRCPKTCGSETLPTSKVFTFHNRNSVCKLPQGSVGSLDVGPLRECGVHLVDPLLDGGAGQTQVCLVLLVQTLKVYQFGVGKELGMYFAICKILYKI